MRIQVVWVVYSLAWTFPPGGNIGMVGWQLWRWWWFISAGCTKVCVNNLGLINVTCTTPWDAGRSYLVAMGSTPIHHCLSHSWAAQKLSQWPSLAAGMLNVMLLPLMGWRRVSWLYSLHTGTSGGQQSPSWTFGLEKSMFFNMQNCGLEAGQCGKEISHGLELRP